VEIENAPNTSKNRAKSADEAFSLRGHAPNWNGAPGTIATVVLANAPAVWLGERMTRLVPLRIVHIVSAFIFLALGLYALLT
jgi:putative Ca2+/H+ antiporter (TMEM165/GDT1 family)